MVGSSDLFPDDIQLIVLFNIYVLTFVVKDKLRRGGITKDKR